MKVRKETILKWTAALRSGEYKQTKHTLQNRRGFCCLGVACKVFNPNYRVAKNGFLKGLMPNTNYGAPLWLHEIHLDFYEKANKVLSILNDSENFSFDEIADLLEAVYVHEVLK